MNEMSNCIVYSPMCQGVHLTSCLLAEADGYHKLSFALEMVQSPLVSQFLLRIDAPQCPG